MHLILNISLPCVCFYCRFGALLCYWALQISLFRRSPAPCYLDHAIFSLSVNIHHGASAWHLAKMLMPLHCSVIAASLPLSGVTKNVSQFRGVINGINRQSPMQQLKADYWCCETLCRVKGAAGLPPWSCRSVDLTLSEVTSSGVHHEMESQWILPVWAGKTIAAFRASIIISCTTSSVLQLEVDRGNFNWVIVYWLLVGSDWLEKCMWQSFWGTAIKILLSQHVPPKILPKIL